MKIYKNSRYKKIEYIFLLKSSKVEITNNINERYNMFMLFVFYKKEIRY